MSLLVLAETSAGYALFKATDKKLLENGGLSQEAATAAGINETLKLKQFMKFDSASNALMEAAALSNSKVSPTLAMLLDSLKDEKKVSLAVADPKLGNAIKKLPNLSIKPVSDSTTTDLYRAIREHTASLIPGLAPEHISTMSLGLSHSLSRHKLRFSPDKVDTMVIQAIHLLDDLDKELNIYAMRVREWYGWHFPEMARIINDNLAYARVVLAVGMRSNAAESDLAEILPEEIESAVKAAAEISMGTEMADEDLLNIRALAEQVVSFTEYRAQLSQYLSNRMQAIAPNLTALVGELVGARLIAHAGSVLQLAKSPASTIQILGAEKALFKALKTKHDTPKYGLIYHASLVGQASGKHKGRIARMLASKAALSLRTDALSDWGTSGEGKGDEPTEEEKASLGNGHRAKLESKLRRLEGRPLASKGVHIGPEGQVKSEKWEVKEARKYNPDADGLDGSEPAARAPKKAKLSSGTFVNPPQRKLVQEVDMEVDLPERGVGRKTKSAVEENGVESDDDDDDDPSAQLNGEAAEHKQKETKEERKARKAAKKAAKAAKKAAKEAKRADKELKRKLEEDTGEDKKKRKKSKH